MWGSTANTGESLSCGASAQLEDEVMVRSARERDIYAALFFPSTLDTGQANKQRDTSRSSEAIWGIPQIQRTAEYPNARGCADRLDPRKSKPQRVGSESGELTPSNSISVLQGQGGRNGDGITTERIWGINLCVIGICHPFRPAFLRLVSPSHALR